MTEKPVVFKNNKGQQLVGMLHLPNKKGKFPAVIMCHGFGKTKIGPVRLFVNLARKLSKNNFVVLRFDFSGCGDSYGKIRDITLTQEIKDLNSAVKYIETLSYIDKNYIGILGHSRGGQVVFEYYQKNRKIKAIIGLAPVINYKWLDIKLYNNKKILNKWKRKGFIITKKGLVLRRYLDDQIKYNTEKSIENIQCPLLIIHGTLDDSINIKGSKEIIPKKTRTRRLEIIKGADHSFTNPEDREKVIKYSINWFKKWLK